MLSVRCSFSSRHTIDTAESKPFPFPLSNLERFFIVRARFDYKRGMEYSLFTDFLASLYSHLDFKRVKINKRKKILHSMLVVETSLYGTQCGNLFLIIRRNFKICFISALNEQ